MKKYFIITGGAGFVGTNLIKKILSETKYKIISIDNYSSGSKNHLPHKNIKYINGDTQDIGYILRNIKKKNSYAFPFW